VNDAAGPLRDDFDNGCFPIGSLPLTWECLMHPPRNQVVRPLRNSLGIGCTSVGRLFMEAVSDAPDFG
jgi:hypothetical protein